jgi:hypothetical protein
MNGKRAKKIRQLATRLTKINFQDFMYQASSEKFFHRVKICFVILFKAYHVSNFVKNKFTKKNKEKNIPQIKQGVIK